MTSVLHCTATRIRIQRRLVFARTEYKSKPFKRRPAAQIAGKRYSPTRREHSVVMSCIEAGRTEAGMEGGTEVGEGMEAREDK